MRKRISYKSRPRPPRACIDPGDAWADTWTYDAGHQGSIEVHDHEEGEDWQDTGLLDKNGEPVWRVIEYVKRPIGFVVPASD